MAADKVENPFKKAASVQKKSNPRKPAAEEMPVISEEKQAEPAVEIVEQQGKEIVKEVEAPVVEQSAPVQAEPEKNTNAEPVQPAAVEQPQRMASVREELVAAYSASVKNKINPKTARIQVLCTPEVKEALKKLEAERKIKSMNDLINSLLETYLGIEHD